MSENNNYYFESMPNNKGKTIPLIICIILMLFLMWLSYYKFFIYDKKGNNSGEIVGNNTNNSNKEKENKENIKEEINEEDNAVDIKKDNEEKIEDKEISDDKKDNKGSYKEIDYEIKEEKNGTLVWNYLYINDKKIGDVRAEKLEIEQYKDVLIVELIDPGPSGGHLIVTGDGKVTYFNSDLLKLEKGWVASYRESYKIDGDNIYLKEIVQFSQGHFDAECRIEDTSLLSSFEIKYEYLGNGKFSNGEMVNKKTIKDNYNGKCNHISIFTDIYTDKLCTRNNDKITCYDKTTYDKAKEKLIEIFGKNNCDSNKTKYWDMRCELDDNYCSLENNGEISCYTHYNL